MLFLVLIYELYLHELSKFVFKIKYMSYHTIGLVLVIIASFFQGSFGLGMKNMKPLPWESWWLVHSIFAMLIIPLVWCLIVTPNFYDVIITTPFQVKFSAIVFGALWGVGGIMFGKSVPYIGMSLTYGIVLGLCAAAGSLIPFFMKNDPNVHEKLPKIITGVMLLVTGVGFTAYAGILKDRFMTASSDEENYEDSMHMKIGLTIAILSGLLSSALGIGFDNGAIIGEVARDIGATVRNSSLAIWVVVLWGGFIINAGYAVMLLFKNKTWNSFSTPKSGKAYMWSVIAALFWFGALGVYGQGASLMGNLGTVIGWPILMGGGLIISNIWAYRSGEWKGAPKALKVLLLGVAIIVVGICVLA